MDKGKKIAGPPANRRPTSSRPLKKRSRDHVGGQSGDDSDSSIFEFTPLLPSPPHIEVTDETEPEEEEPSEEAPLTHESSEGPRARTPPVGATVERIVTSEEYQQLVADHTQSQRRIAELEAEIHEHHQLMETLEARATEAEEEASHWRAMAFQYEAMRDRAEEYTRHVSGQMTYVQRIASAGTARLHALEDHVELTLDQALEPLIGLTRQIRARQARRAPARRVHARRGHERTPPRTPPRRDVAGPSTRGEDVGSSSRAGPSRP